MNRISITITSDETDFAIFTRGIDEDKSILAGNIAYQLFTAFSDHLLATFSHNEAMRLCLAYHIAECSALIMHLERNGIAI